MFLGAYDFDGDSETLLTAYSKLMAAMPPDVSDLHICVVRDGGITVFDACPSRAVFESFSTGPDFAGAVAAAGLPAPTVRLAGDVVRAYLREEVAP